MAPSEFSRRSVFALGGIGIGSVVALTGCAGAPKARTTAGGQEVLATLADIPVGGSVSATLGGAPILISQPKSGTVVAFNAICPHQGCRVLPKPKDLECPCHQSRFDSTTGALLAGPSPRGLDPIAVAISGDFVVPSA